MRDKVVAVLFVVFCAFLAQGCGFGSSENDADEAAEQTEEKDEDLSEIREQLTSDILEYKEGPVNITVYLGSTAHPVKFLELDSDPQVGVYGTIGDLSVVCRDNTVYYNVSDGDGWFIAEGADYDEWVEELGMSEFMDCLEFDDLYYGGTYVVDGNECPAYVYKSDSSVVRRFYMNEGRLAYLQQPGFFFRVGVGTGFPDVSNAAVGELEELETVYSDMLDWAAEQAENADKSDTLIRIAEGDELLR